MSLAYSEACTSHPTPTHRFVSRLRLEQLLWIGGEPFGRSGQPSDERERVYYFCSLRLTFGRWGSHTSLVIQGQRLYALLHPDTRANMYLGVREWSYFPGAIKVSVSTVNITANQMLSRYALCQGLPSNALDYQSPSAPYDSYHRAEQD